MEDSMANLPSDDEIKQSLGDFTDPDRHNPLRDREGQFNWWRFLNIWPLYPSFNTGLIYVVYYWWKRPEWPASTKVLLTAGLAGLVALFIWVFASGVLGVPSRYR